MAGAMPIESPSGRQSRAHLLLAAAALAGCSKSNEAPAQADPQASPSVVATVASSTAAPSASASSPPSSSGGELIGIASAGTAYGKVGMSGAYGAPPSPLGTSPAAGPRAKISDVVGCSVPAATRILAGQQPRFRTCYALALKGDPSVAGTLRLALTVAPAGDVTAVRVVSSSTSKTVASCATSVAKSVTFPESEAKCEVAFTVAFTP